jgi:hypothetical protein
MDRTRLIELHGGQRREEAHNACTRFPSADELLRLHGGQLPRERSFEELFLAHYPAIRRTCEGFAPRGVAVFAVDGFAHLAGSLCLRANEGEVKAAIIGRHGLCDLYLDGDPGLSLRHLVLLLHPDRSDDVRLRVLDLRTSLAFKDESGRTLEGIAVEGPAFIRCSSFALFFFPTGDGIPWPDDPAAGWQCIPERVYLEERDASPGERRRARRDRRAAPAQGGPSADPVPGEAPITHITSIRGPLHSSQELLASGEPTLGELRLRRDGDEHTLRVGEEAARRGILLGRYDRCDAHGSPGLDDARVSRVHLLLYRLDDELYAVDAASTNGTFTPSGEDVRVARLVRGDRLLLSRGAVEIEWQQT